MHLGLVDETFVAHDLISTQERTVPLLKLQMAPRIKILMASGSKKGTHIYFSFLSKVPANEPPPGSPTVPLWRGRSVYRAFGVSLKKTSSFGFSSKGALPQGPPPCEGLSVALVIQHAERMRHIILLHVACRFYSILPHCLINGKIFGRKKLLNTKCVF